MNPEFFIAENESVYIGLKTFVCCNTHYQATQKYCGYNTSNMLAPELSQHSFRRQLLQRKWFKERHLWIPLSLNKHNFSSFLGKQSIVTSQKCVTQTQYDKNNSHYTQ